MYSIEQEYVYGESPLLLSFNKNQLLFQKLKMYYFNLGIYFLFIYSKKVRDEIEI